MELLLLPLIFVAIVLGFKFIVESMFGLKGSQVAGANSIFRPANLLLALLDFDRWRRLRQEGATFMDQKELQKLLNPNNKGLLIDGKDRRMSLASSFTHNMIVAPTGAGKTTRYVIPNLLTMDDCSFVVTDPAGELFAQTAGALQAKGFEVQVFAPESPNYSLQYNPLSNLSSFAHIDQVAQTIIRSAYPDASGDTQFFNDGATDVISMLIRCLMAAGPEYLNLGNVQYLLQSWGDLGSGLNEFMRKYADDTADAQFRGFIAGNEKTTQSFISTATTALKPLNDPEMQNLLCRNELRFEGLRERKTALFFILPSNKVKFYSFLMNLFYVDLFDVLMQKLPHNERAAGRKFLPVHLMMDEFGHTSIPEFSTVCTTIRKHEVSLSVILQYFSQLETNYGKAEAQTIIEGGFQSKMFLPGLSTQASQEVEAMLGKQLVNEVRWDGQSNFREQNLMNADRIRTMADNKAIFMTSNKEAIMLETMRSFENKRFVQQMRRKYTGTIQRRGLSHFQRVPLT